MKKLSVLLTILLSACGGDDASVGAGAPVPAVDAFVSKMEKEPASASEDTEPISVDAVVATAPENTEPVALKN
jgi:hypothetical protein